MIAATALAHQLPVYTCNPEDFTGIDDPYEAPEHPEVTFGTQETTPEENSDQILKALVDRGFLRE